MLKFIKEAKSPELLVVTPLLTGHKLSGDTKVRLSRNKMEFAWVSYESQGNTAANFSEGIAAYRKQFSAPKYVMMIDRDILPGRCMLDKMFDTLERSNNEVAYCYCDFEFKGSVNKSFQGHNYDPMLLLQNNYISSNSMIKLEKLDEIGGVVTDNKYKRLLDWCLWLQFLSFGYYGIRCPDAYFIAISEKDSVSAGSPQEYQFKRNLVREDFIQPLLSGVIF